MLLKRIFLSVLDHFPIPASMNTMNAALTRETESKIGRPKDIVEPMEWNRSETLALAAPACTRCHGVGIIRTRRSSEPCHCVLRSIFRACYARFRHCVTKEKFMSKASLEATAFGHHRREVWGRKDEEYIADFALVSRRYLEEAEYRIFKFHFLLGADWRLCCRRLKMDRGNFFHMVYNIQQKLGRVFRELQPFGLYPLDEYFQGTTRVDPVLLRSNHSPIPIRSCTPLPVVPPLERAA